MEFLAGTELVVQQAGRWDPADVAFVRRIAFENVSEDSFDLALLLLLQPKSSAGRHWPNVHAPFWDVDVLFQGLRDLSWLTHGPWDLQTRLFVIQDIRPRQWDGVNLLVFDEDPPDREHIGFSAKSAVIRGCQPTAIPPQAPDVRLQRVAE